MQARLETRRFPAAAVAVIFAILAVLLVSAGSGYAIKSLSAPSIQKAAPAVRHAGPDASTSSQQTGGDTYFSTCTQLVRKPC